MSPEPTAEDLPQPTRQDRQTAETLSLGDIVADTGNPTNPAPPQKDATAAATAVTALHPTTLIGRTYDDLEFQEELGRGGMGIVFKARQKSLNRTVAVKLLLAEHYVDPVRLARFHAEARAAANLDHPNIVQVFQVGQCAVGHYFVMEYVDGQSLEAIVKSGKVSKSYAVSVLSVVAEAVHYAHTKGIVHRDLKPANILMDKSNRPVVMDFGIVKFVGKSSSLTQQGAIIGTPAFMAPEQAGETSEQVGPQSDVYSLGAILYMLLTGRAPYDEGTPLRTILKVIGPEMPPAVRTLRRDVPRELERICMKCLSKHSSERFPSAWDLAEELRDFVTKVRKQKAGGGKVAAKSTMRANLPALFLVAEETGKRIRLGDAGGVIGRTSECDVVVRAGDVSKRHCEVLREGDRVVVKDLNSANGTFVNDEPVQRAPLCNGDRLRIAGHTFVVEISRRRG